MSPGRAPGVRSAHVPVMRDEVLELLDPRPGAVVVDATVGAGGHAEALLARLGPEGRLIGIDRDAEALHEARSRLGDDPRLRLVHADYRQIADILEREGAGMVAGVLADLGVSSIQLEGAGRGFSFARDEALDMRMDRSRGATAAEWLEAQDESGLRRALRQWGEEPDAGRIARALRRRRDLVGPIRTTGALAETVRAAVRARRPRRIDPATRTFQAIRIAVNDELRGLGGFVRDAVAALGPGGRLVVLSFHSIEDREVKRALRGLAGECTCPPGLPACACGRAASVRLLTRRPRRPSPAEVERNPRSRSAKLRAAERLPGRAA